MSTADAIAVIGMSCRFPGGADDPEAYWRLLRGGVDAIVEVPKARWDIDAVFDPDPGAAGKMYTRWGGFLRSRIDLFDAEFFAISLREAPSIDPQHRLFLEVCWEALERAGVAPDRLKHSLSGVFAGIFSHDYAEIIARDPGALNAYSNVGVSAGAVAGRVSYLLGLRGPSLTVDTASSSSLVAVHLACESLRGRRSHLALAGGVNLVLTPTIGIGFCRAGALSPDGRCRVFDAAASGYVRSEGCGVVVLKRLADAIADRDPILAVLRGTAVNQDGASDGLMAPSPEAQAALLRQALEDAGLAPAQVSYLEAHGTGTQVGDRAEAQAIAAVYGGDRDRRAALVLGSAKTHLGHLESAAGIAGLIKVILALQHREIPPNLHFTTRNPALPLDEIPAVVPVEPTPWDPRGGALVAGVSSFGFSGTNAHVLVEAAPAHELDADGRAPPRPCHLLCLSARSAPALVALGHRYRDYLASHPGQRLADVCFSAGHGRGHFPERLAIVAHSNEELQVKLDAVGSGGSPAGAIRGEAGSDAEPSRVAFLFPGGGAQYPAMGRELYGTQPTFRAALDRCAAILEEHLPEPLCSVLWGERSALLDRMDTMQPALFSIEYALSELWRSWGIEPGALIGHSLGEYVAATVAGVFSLEDGLRLISRRAALMHAAPERGAMAAIAASEDRVREVLDTGWRRVSIGAVNGPESTMISGDRAELHEVLARFEAQGVKVRLLPISHASHSPLMDPILDAFEEAARAISYARPALPLISNLTGRWALADEVCHPGYWRSHIRRTVRFADGMRTLLDEGCRGLVEVGPGTALLGMGQDCAPAGLRAAWCPSIRSDRGEWEQILESLGALYVRGAKVDWVGLGRGEPARAIALPTYPFQRRSYWVGAATGASDPLGGGPGAPRGLDDPGAHAAAPEPVRSTGLRARRILGEAEPHRRRELLRTFVRDELARALGHAAMAEVDLSRPFRELGVDSFMSQVLRARLVEELGAHLEDEIPRTVLFAYSNVASLADFLLEKISPPSPAAASTPAGREPAVSRDPSDVEREPIAIIGMACRFPGGADSPSSFWQVLRDGVDAIGEVPEDRWDVDALYDPDPDAPGKMTTRWGGFLAGPVDAFDAAFFGISPREAESMDPQQRLFLETAWAALEDAGQPPRALAGTRTGVYAGVFGHDYLTLQVASRDAVNAHTGTGGNESIVAGRLSYLLGARGPSLVVNTACSSSLVAIHLAVQSLRGSECDLALAGGVNLILTPEPTVAFSKARMMAADGRCKTFDESADGYVRGEGAGVLVLRRLSSAVRAQDRILAVIRGTAVNQDGASNGLTAPSPAAQEALIRQALSEARVAPGQVRYVEAHGTGTPLGDPIEVQALGAVLSEGRAPDDPVYLGSVKTNIGHLESAAGVAGVIKVVLALEHEEIPPHLHLKRVNPLLQLDRIPARVPTHRVPWARGGGRRIAGVSSFGFSGTNAHVVLEEAPPTPARPEPGAPGAERPMHVLCLSARTAPALAALAADHARMFEASPAMDLGDHCFSAGAGRSHLERRLAIVGRSAAEIREQLGAFQAGAPSGAIAGALDAGDRAPAVAFLFTGQGSQYAGMGKRLHQTQATFRRVFDQCAEILAPCLPVPLPDVLWSDRPEVQALVDETQYTQPALFALEYALWALWNSWGVVPVAVMGHSVGELVAAAVAGVFSLEDGLRLTARRASLMQALPAGGEMASVAASEARVREVIAPHAPALCVAASNSPTSTVISGPSGPLRAVLAELEAEGLRVTRLRVSRAFHSPLMDPMLDELERFASAISYQTPRLAIISNLTGEPYARDVPCTARYFRRHAREAVRFSEGMAALARLGIRRFVEVGPHPALLSIGEACLPDPASARWLPSLRRDADDWSRLLRSLGELYVSGIEIDWRGFDRDHARSRVALPTYPFQRERYWIPAVDARLTAPQGGDPILGHRVDLPGGTAVFEITHGIRAMPWLSDHRIYGPVIVPAAGQIARLLHLAKALRRERGAEIAEILFERPIVLGDEELRKVQVHVSLAADAAQRVEIFSHDESARSGSWVRNASGQLRAPEPTEDALRAPDARAILGRCVELPVEQYFAVFRGVGVDLGPSFRWATRAWVGPGEALVRLREPRSEESGSGFVLHPGLLDSFITAGVHVALRSRAAMEGTAFLPLSIERLAWFEEHGAALWCHAVLREAAEDSFTLDLVAWDALGRVVARIGGLVLRRASEDKLLANLRRDPRDRPAKGRYHGPSRGAQPMPSAAQEAPRGPGPDGTRAAPEASALWPSEHHRPGTQAPGRSGSQPPQPRLLALLRGAAPPEREAILRTFLASELRHVLGFDASRQIDPEARLPGLGLDSWMAMELRDRVIQAVGDAVKIPLTLVFDHPSLRELTTYLLQSLAGSWEDATPTMDSRATSPSGRAPDRTAENEPIAIIGMACRFPGGANDLRSYWRLLQRGRDAIVEVPRERWDVDACFDPDPAAPGKMYSRWGGFLQGAPIDTFDAAFFRVSAEEARVMDPQQRLVLEVTWEALEDAGIAQRRLEGSAGGVFLGVSAMDFPGLAGEASAITSHANPGKYLSVIAGRVSYFLGLRGPSFVVDTACSSSLVAIHLACQSLRRGESTIALSGGVNLMLSPSPTIGFCKARMLSADGPSRSFDAAAGGYSRGEGCGVIVLKRLSDARRDGDRILSVIRGSAVNNNGKSGTLTMPNGLAQREVMQHALREAGLSPAEVSLIEAHGTATLVGDAIEVQALGEVFSAGRGASDPLLITSVKTHLGHLEPAAGIAGVIKVVLALQREEIPAHLHLTQVNPLIALSAIPAAIPVAQTPWKRGDKPRIAGVSAFAFQGTNAHVILAEAPAAAPRQSRPPAEHRGHVFTFSAKCPAAQRSLAEAHLEHLERGEPGDVFDACFTVNSGRTHFGHRVAVTCSSRDELTEKLRRFLEGGQAPGLFQGHARPEFSVGLRFEPGATTHLGEWLFEAHAIHRAALDRIAVAVGEHSGGEHPAAPQGRDRGAELEWLARAHTWCELWRSWGVDPAWVEGIAEAAPGAGGGFDLDQSVRRVLGDPARSAASGGSAQGDPIRVDHVLVIGAAPRSTSPEDADLTALDAAGDWGQIHAALARLHVRGAPVDWSELDRGRDRRKVSMPTYPFQRKRVAQGEQP